MPTWPQLNPGKMVHQITILKQQTSSDNSGQTIVWVPFVTTWAEIEPVHGTDIVRSGQDTTKLFSTVKVRWQPGIAPSMRVQKVDGTQMIIQAIENPGERNILLVLLCLALGENDE